jgi:enoyl-CoA hydratase/carnithine racemase
VTDSRHVATATGGVEARRDGPVLRVVLNDPSTRNALSSAKLAILREALDTVRNTPQVRVVVLSGAGGVFSSGWELDAGFGSDHDAGQRALLNTYAALATCRVPVIAQVEGVAFGAAVGLIGASDLAVAGEQAVFCLPEPRFGRVAFPAMVPCLARWRLAEATRYLITGERFTGAAAAAAGLVSCAVPAGAVAGAVEEMVAAVVAGSPSAITATKRTLRRLTTDQPSGLPNEAAALASLVDAEEAAEGAAAWRDRRSPSWVSPRGG